ncbi:conserved hypothetical protein [Syntrophobacter sp. SbD1]|nr:conserved hypothetical protein [Syntrophobacter sp. SbD1]
MEKKFIKEEEPVNAEPAAEDEAGDARNQVKFEVFGEEMLDKQVKPSGNSGRVYLPPDWVGCRVKVIRI